MNSGNPLSQKHISNNVNYEKLIKDVYSLAKQANEKGMQLANTLLPEKEESPNL